jgi:hypothetical protein
MEEAFVGQRQKILKGILGYSVITNFLGQSPSLEAVDHLFSLDIPRLLWILKAHYRVHKRPPVDRTRSHINPL